MLARARTLGWDNDANLNFGVNPADALVLFNDVLMRWSFNVRSKPKYLAATTTGLTFTSGTVYKETSDNTDSTRRISAFESFHPAAADTLAFPLPPALNVRTVDEIRDLLRYDGDVALTAQASEWTDVAWERTQDATAAGAEKYRVWAYPVINRTRYLTARAAVYTQVATIAETPDVLEEDTPAIERFLAWEIATRNNLPKERRDDILAPLPRELVEQMHGGAALAAQLQDRVDWRDS
jgi:hypothetical protein